MTRTRILPLAYFKIKDSLDSEENDREADGLAVSKCGGDIAAAPCGSSGCNLCTLEKKLFETIEYVEHNEQTELRKQTCSFGCKQPTIWGSELDLQSLTKSDSDVLKWTVEI
jgi:hypothetical protein